MFANDPNAILNGSDYDLCRNSYDKMLNDSVYLSLEQLRRLDIRFY